MAISGRCGYCGVRRPCLTRDHMHPVSLGGPDLTSNLIFSCYRCNQMKANHTVDGFRHLLSRSALGEFPNGKSVKSKVGRKWWMLVAHMKNTGLIEGDRVSFFFEVARVNDIASAA